MKILSSLREKAHTLHECIIQKVLDLRGVVVTAKEKAGPCDLCQGPMHVQKTFKHEGRTIAHGTFDVNETIWVCAARCRHPSGELVTRRSNSVAQCIMPKSITGYDLMVSVGLKRHLEHRQREEIRSDLLEKHGIKISSGEVSLLARCFLDYLSRLHYARADQLKAALERDGGWPMHVDATGENGRDLLEVLHSELRELFRRTKIRPKLRVLVRDLSRQLGKQIDEGRKAVQTWQSMTDTNHGLPEGQDGLAIVRAMGQWTLDYKAEATNLDFPFDQPYLDFYNRCMITLRAIDAFLRIPPNDQQVIGSTKRLHRILADVYCEVPFLQLIRKLRRRVTLFVELRNTLRLASYLPENESEEDLNAMRENFEKWIDSIEKSRPERGPSEDIRNAIDIILKHVDTHGCNLWGHAILLPEYSGGGIRLVARTNELLENLFKKIKHSERRRSGRKNLTQDLEHLPASAALSCNLNDDEYVSIVCGSLDKLADVFAQLDQEEQRRLHKGLSPMKSSEDLEHGLQLSTSSLSTLDRRIVRTEGMNRRIKKAAKSRAPRLPIEG